MLIVFSSLIVVMNYKIEDSKGKQVKSASPVK